MRRKDAAKRLESATKMVEIGETGPVAHVRPACLAAASLRVITELHGRMDDVTKLQRDRQPAILRGEHARVAPSMLCYRSGTFELRSNRCKSFPALENERKERRVSLRDRYKNYRLIDRIS